MPKKSGRRRGGDDKGRDYRKAARAITRACVRPVAAAIPWLADTLDWLNLWHHDTAQDAPAVDHQETAPNHLSPHL